MQGHCNHNNLIREGLLVKLVDRGVSFIVQTMHVEKKRHSGMNRVIVNKAYNKLLTKV